MDKWNQLADKQTTEKVVASLKANGIEAELVENGEQAKQRILEILPAGAEVMDMTSVTLDTTKIPQEINQSSKYNSVRNKLNRMDRKTQNLEMQKLGAAPEWTVGSVHAVTEDGHLLIASNTGSQLSAYADGSAHVIWVVGTQKIVKDTEQGLKRIYEYVLPLESERANKAYGITTGSFVSKLLIVNREINPGRITVIFVNEVLGF